MKILLVEDSDMVAKGLIYSLKQNGYDVIHKTTEKETITFLKENSVNLVILDISLPDGNGFDIYENVIKEKKIPTVFLTAKDEEDDIVRGLESGADDYMTKPFSTRELIARINKILSKESKNSVCREKEIIFSSLELKILNLLFTNLNKVVTREEIIYKIWEWTGNDVYDNTVTVYLKRIREKLSSDIISTIKGIGYRIDEK